MRQLDLRVEPRHILEWYFQRMVVLVAGYYIVAQVLFDLKDLIHRILSQQRVLLIFVFRVSFFVTKCAVLILITVWNFKWNVFDIVDLFSADELNGTDFFPLKWNGFIFHRTGQKAVEFSFYIFWRTGLLFIDFSLNLSFGFCNIIIKSVELYTFKNLVYIIVQLLTLFFNGGFFNLP